MKAETVFVTPEMAAEWLKRNERNRKINPKHVSNLARAIAQGDWTLNGEAVKLSTQGQILDGQHRLEAIVEAGVGIFTLVVSDLPQMTQETMDQGRKRSFADALSMAGVPNATLVQAIARRAWMWDRGNLRFSNTDAPSVQEQDHTLEKYPHIHRSAELASRASTAYRPSRGAVTGTAHHLFIQIDPDQTAQFFASFASGLDLSKGHPVAALRQRLLNDVTTSKRVPFHQGLAYFIRTWNAVREGREMAKIQHTAEEPMIKPV